MAYWEANKPRPGQRSERFLILACLEHIPRQNSCLYRQDALPFYTGPIEDVTRQELADWSAVVRAVGQSSRTTLALDPFYSDSVVIAERPNGRFLVLDFHGECTGWVTAQYLSQTLMRQWQLRDRASELHNDDGTIRLYILDTASPEVHAAAPGEGAGPPTYLVHAPLPDSDSRPDVPVGGCNSDAMRWRVRLSRTMSSPRESNSASLNLSNPRSRESKSAPLNSVPRSPQWMWVRKLRRVFQRIYDQRYAIWLRDTSATAGIITPRAVSNQLVLCCITAI